MCVRATTLLRACYRLVEASLKTFQPGFGVFTITEETIVIARLLICLNEDDPGGGKPSQGPVFGEAVNTQLGQ